MSTWRTRVTHLVTRFTRSLVARPLDDADMEWVAQVLTPEERAVWSRLGRADRAESVDVARRAARELRTDSGPWIAAALLHDVGKQETRLGSVGRSLATVTAGVAGHRRARGWTDRRGWRGGVGRYVSHDTRGAELLRAAGARPEAVEWAAVHHRRQAWQTGTIPADVCIVLAQADGESVRPD